MADKPQKSRDQQPQAPVRESRRTLSRKRQEQQRQRRIIITTSVALGLALMVLIIGVVFDQLWIPSRPVAAVNNITLNRGDYWTEVRTNLAEEVVQNQQLLAFFGGNPQVTGQFANRGPDIEQRLTTVRDDPLNDTVVDNWITRQLKIQGADELGISVSEDEVLQAIATDLGPVFATAPPAEPTAAADDATAEPTGEAAAEATAAASPTTAAATATTTSTPAATPTPGGPTVTPAPTLTPEPTFTPQPTPAVELAREQFDQIADTLYERHEDEVELVGAIPDLNEDDIRRALQRQYRERLLDERLQEALLPESEFTADTEPVQVQARQILVEVDVAEDASEAERDAAFAEQRALAEEIGAELRAGADFAELAADRSADPGSREQGGDLGFFNREGQAAGGATYPPELVETAFALEPGEISDPIRTQFGWHIIEVTDTEVPSREDQLAEARATALDEWIEEQRAAATIQRFPEPEPTVLSPTEAVPTPAPTFLPGPPTAVPTATPTAEVGPPAPANGTPAAETATPAASPTATETP